MLRSRRGFHAHQPRRHGRKRRTPSIDYRRRSDQPVLEVTGLIGADHAAQWRLSTPIFFAQRLRWIDRRGIAVTGSAVDQDDVAGSFRIDRRTAHDRHDQLAPATPDRDRPHESQSEPLRRNVIKAIGGARDGLGTFDGGLNAVRATLTSWGILTDSYATPTARGSTLPLRPRP